MKTEKDRWNENCDAAIEQLQDNLKDLAARQTGIDPLGFLVILENTQRLPERIDAKLIVIPEAWGKAN